MSNTEPAVAGNEEALAAALAQLGLPADASLSQVLTVLRANGITIPTDVAPTREAAAQAIVDDAADTAADVAHAKEEVASVVPPAGALSTPPAHSSSPEVVPVSGTAPAVATVPKAKVLALLGDLHQLLEDAEAAL